MQVLLAEFLKYIVVIPAEVMLWQLKQSEEVEFMQVKQIWLQAEHLIVLTPLTSTVVVLPKYPAGQVT